MELSLGPEEAGKRDFENGASPGVLPSIREKKAILVTRKQRPRKKELSGFNRLDLHPIGSLQTD